MQKGTVIGFDFGEKRIGVAVGELETRLANPLTTISEEATDRRFAAIEKLLNEWKPVLLVVGLPVSMDGTEHKLTLLARKFANRLNGRFSLPVEFCDERLSSAVADDMLRDLGLKARARKVSLDTLAAQQILQAWLEHAPSDIPNTSTNGVAS